MNRTFEIKLSKRKFEELKNMANCHYKAFVTYNSRRFIFIKGTNAKVFIVNQ